MGTKSKAGVVYEYRCQCGMVYVGETGRTLRTREMDHRRAIAKGNQDHSGISKHVLETGHEILWDEVRIACHERIGANERSRKAIIYLKSRGGNASGVARISPRGWPTFMGAPR